MPKTFASHLLGRLRKAVGRNEPIAPEIPIALAIGIARAQASALARGLIRLRAPVFLGPGIKLRGKRGIKWGRWVSIGAGADIDGFGVDGTEIGAGSRIGAHTIITVTSHVGRIGKGFRMGPRSGLGDFCHVGASGGVTIGRDVLCASYVSFHSQNHVFTDTGVPVRDQGVTEEGIFIGDGSWLGAGVRVLDGTVIGENCVVAAGAVVSGHFPPRSLIGGVPARVIRDLDAERAPGAPQGDL